MLKELTKIANKLDGLGLTKEADLLDKVISKMAGIGEGSPAYMSKGTGDSELEVNESGEFEYPEGKTLKGTDHPSYGGKAKPETTAGAFSDFLSATTGCINDIFDMIEKTGYSYGIIINLKEDIKSIAKELSEDLSSNELDTEEDVMDSIESLITEMDESILGNWGHPSLKGQPYQMFCDWEENHMADEMVGVEISKHYSPEDMMRDTKTEMKRWARVGISIEKSIESFKSVKSEQAYIQFEDIRDTLDPIIELADKAKEIYDDCKEDIESKYEALKEAIDDLGQEAEMPSGEYELPPVAKGSDHPMGWDRLEQTSPEQAQFEEDQEPYGDADVVGEDWREDEDEGEGDEDEAEEAQHLTHRDGPEKEEEEEEEEEEEGYRGNRRITEVPSQRFR